MSASTRLQTVQFVTPPAPTASDAGGTFPAEHIVECAIGNCRKVNGKINASPRICQSQADLTSWICPYCLLPVHLDQTDEPPEWAALFAQETDGQRLETAHAKRAGRTAYIDGQAAQVRKPRALDNSQRLYPEWTRDDVMFAAVCAELRRRRDGERNARLLYLYYRACLGLDEIAHELGLTTRLAAERLASTAQDELDRRTGRALRRALEKRVARIRELARRMGFRD